MSAVTGGASDFLDAEECRGVRRCPPLWTIVSMDQLDMFASREETVARLDLPEAVRREAIIAMARLLLGVVIPQADCGDMEVDDEQQGS